MTNAPATVPTTPTTTREQRRVVKRVQSGVDAENRAPCSPRILMVACSAFFVLSTLTACGPDASTAAEPDAEQLDSGAMDSGGSGDDSSAMDTGSAEDSAPLMDTELPDSSGPVDTTLTDTTDVGTTDTEADSDTSDVSLEQCTAQCAWFEANCEWTIEDDGHSVGDPFTGECEWSCEDDISDGSYGCWTEWVALFQCIDQQRQCGIANCQVPFQALDACILDATDDEAGGGSSVFGSYWFTRAAN